MEVLINPASLPYYFQRTSITIGNFDGLHKGHQALIERVIRLSALKRTVPGIITFSPHPQKSLDISKAPSMLMSLQKKMQILQDMNLKLMVIFDFDHKFSHLSPDIFARDYIAGMLRARDVVIGENFRFGRGGEGDSFLLSELGSSYGFEANIVKSLEDDEGNIISSTYIRDCIKKGYVDKAGKLLGRYYSISGKVQKGKGIGCNIGFPTANIPLPEQIVPKRGVYITLCSTGTECYPSLTNIGMTPSVSSRPLTIEVHIINQSMNIYNEDIEISFIKRLRDEKKFDTVEDLQKAITADIETGRDYFRKGECNADECAKISNRV